MEEWMDFAGNFPSFFFFFFGVQSDPATFKIFKSENSYSFHKLGFYAGNLFYHWIVFITNWLLTLTLICLKTRLIKLLPMKIVSKAMQRDNAYIPEKRKYWFWISEEICVQCKENSFTSGYILYKNCLHTNQYI